MSTRHFTDLECRDTVYITPDYLLEPIRTYFGGRIPLDPATELWNPTKADEFCVAPPTFPTVIPKNASIDGFRKQWSKSDGVFVNPPYGQILPDWCRKIYQESLLGVTIFALLPAGARFSTRYFQRFIFSQHLVASFFPLGRVQFYRPDGTEAKQNPWDSVIYCLGADLERVKECFCDRTRPDGRPLGKLLETRVI